MRTSLTLTEVWPISDCIIRQKYYCITVHYRTMCTSENCLGQTVQTGQQALGHLELFSDYVRGPTLYKIPVGILVFLFVFVCLILYVSLNSCSHVEAVSHLTTFFHWQA